MSGPRSFRPRKSLGQHFLVHQGVVNRVIGAAAIGPGEPVLEIGPGRGALTVPLARSAGTVVAVEKDPLLVDYLREKLRAAGIGNVTIHQADILRWDFQALETRDGVRHVVLGNLPYNISSPLIEKLTFHRRWVSRAVLMLQEEMALRLTAGPGKKDYGAMTVLVGYVTRVSPVLRVSREAFRPRPGVDSMVVHLDFDAPYPRRALDDEVFRKVVKAAFGQRRKTLWNALAGKSGSWPRECVAAACESCGVDPRRRGETLDMEEFLCLSDALALTNAAGGGT